MPLELSYIISTFNRLPFLKITLAKLIEAAQPTDEIVVVDGNSIDGSKEYLQQLFDEKKIHQFISEPDQNQAHGWNKALLMAKGTIIKKIIDDDVFCFEAINICKNYMLQNSAVDVVISNDLSGSLANHEHIQKLSRLSHFENWKNGLTPSFTFGDVNMLIRKSALACIGLYNTGFVMMDWEYALRISYLKANITYFTGFNALSVAHPNTVTSQKNTNLISEQGMRGNIFYEYAGDHANISLWSKIKISVGKMIYPATAITKEKMPLTDVDTETIYKYYYSKINELNRQGKFNFIDSTIK